MLKQKLIRWGIFTLIVGWLLWRLSSQQPGRTTAADESKVLPAQTEKKIEQIKDLIKEQEIPEKVLGLVGEMIPALKKDQETDKTQAEVIIEEKVREIIKEIQSLPLEQVEEVKKEVFCNEVCDTTCQEMCQ